jgi:hypothetical protein
MGLLVQMKETRNIYIILMGEPTEKWPKPEKLRERYIYVREIILKIRKSVLELLKLRTLIPEIYASK